METGRKKLDQDVGCDPLPPAFKHIQTDGTPRDEAEREQLIHDTFETAPAGMTVDLIKQVTQSKVIKRADGGVLTSLWHEISGTGMAPWEIHRPQQVVMKLAKTGVFRGHSVLDIGCGIGDSALYLARYCQCDVTAFELVPRAIEFAKSKEALRAGMRGKVRWLVADVLDLKGSALEGCRFDVLLDVATFHGFSDQERLAYRHSVGSLARPGSVLLLSCFSDKWPQHKQGGPRRVSAQEIHSCFNSSTGWHVETITDTMLEHHPSLNWEEARQVLDPRKDPQRWTYIWRGYAEACLATIRKL